MSVGVAVAVLVGERVGVIVGEKVGVEVGVDVGCGVKLHAAIESMNINDKIFFMWDFSL